MSSGLEEYSLRHITRALRSFPRMGADEDVPEGARWVQITDTCLSGICTRLDEIAEGDMLADSSLLLDLMFVIRESFPGAPELADQSVNFAVRCQRLFARLKK